MYEMFHKSAMGNRFPSSRASMSATRLIWVYIDTPIYIDKDIKVET